MAGDTLKTSSARGGTSAPASASASLRDRTRRAMQAEVSAVAFRLFADQGFDGTTVDQIAAEAGLSRTTFFRYFGTKEDVVLCNLGELGREVSAALSARPEDPTARALVGAALACLDAAKEAWTTCDGTTPLPAILDRAMEIMNR
jgi:AcrR family transcriptional regulator